MRAPDYFECPPEANPLVRNSTVGEACSAGAVFWDIGIVLAAFLGLALTITAALTAFGID